MKPLRKTHRKCEARPHGEIREFFRGLNRLLRIATSKLEMEMLPDVVRRSGKRQRHLRLIPTKELCVSCQRLTSMDQRMQPRILPTVRIFGRMAPLGRAE